jgi:hypothetical protein
MFFGSSGRRVKAMPSRTELNQIGALPSSRKICAFGPWWSATIIWQ